MEASSSTSPRELTLDEYLRLDELGLLEKGAPEGLNDKTDLSLMADEPSLRCKTECITTAHDLEQASLGSDEREVVRPRAASSWVLEGCLEQRGNGLLQGWKRRYCYLSNDHLYCYADSLRCQLVGCVNFKLLSCQAQQKEDVVIQLGFGDNRLPLLLRAPNKQEAEMWIKGIRSVVKQWHDSRKIKFRSQMKHLYQEKDAIPEKDYLQCAETGDILLMRTGDATCALQRLVTSSEYDHIAIVVRFAQGQVKIFEANAQQGVCLYDWDQFHLKFTDYDMVCYRRLNCENREELQGLVKGFIKKTIGHKYDLGVMKLMRNTSTDEEETTRSYFCSELVAKLYKMAGYLPSEKASSKYWPIDFTESACLRLEGEAYLDRERLIILNRHLKVNYQ